MKKSLTSLIGSRYVASNFLLTLTTFRINFHAFQSLDIFASHDRADVSLSINLSYFLNRRASA